jgi:hypothetical protein
LVATLIFGPLNSRRAHLRRSIPFLSATTILTSARRRPGRHIEIGVALSKGAFAFEAEEEGLAFDLRVEEAEAALALRRQRL